MKDLTMQMAKCQRMTAHIYFRTTKAELARLNRAAKVLGITRSAMIRAAVEARANRIIGSIITLTKQDTNPSWAPVPQESGAGAPCIEITSQMLAAGRESLLASFPEDVLSDRTPGLDRAVSDIFRAMLGSAVSRAP